MKPRERGWQCDKSTIITTSLPLSPRSLTFVRAKLWDNYAHRNHLKTSSWVWGRGRGRGGWGEKQTCPLAPLCVKISNGNNRAGEWRHGAGLGASG